MRFFGCFAIRRTFCFLYSSVRVEQIYSLLEKSSEYISGIEGSSLKSHSRRVSLDTLAPSTPCFVKFASAKRLSTVLPRSPVGSDSLASDTELNLLALLVMFAHGTKTAPYVVRFARESGTKHCSAVPRRNLAGRSKFPSF